ncbi:Carnitine O-acetyltransferase mitochondrial [Cryptotrichosporon argae]
MLTRLARTPAARTMPIAIRAASTVTTTVKPSASSSERVLYASQSSLPRLPVPPLSQTLPRYLDTLRPLLPASEFARSSALVAAFAEDPFAAELQRRLEARAAERTSWLSEWWNEAAYMGYRGRLVPNVSYFYVHKRDASKGKSQARRAAELVRATVEFKKLVDSERLQPEKVRGQPLCMESYKYLFNAARIPTRPSDVAHAHDKATNHVVVLANDRVWKVEASGNADDLEAAFAEVKEKSRDPGQGVGILTSEDRDVWANAYKRLTELGNAAALQTVESAILVVCLDDNAPATDDDRAWAYWAGGSRDARGRNRWFDKHQIIVGSDGVSGFNGEHSMLDGTPTLRLNEFMLASLTADKIPLDGPTVPGCPTELVFKLNDALRSQIAASKSGFSAEMAKQEVCMVTFGGYGKGAIKTHRVSPDAWAQMAKQLAFHRLFGRPGVTYESCQTRKYALGRTEVIRAASAESRAFAEAMLDAHASDADRAAKFRAACKRHAEYSAWAADGQGVDRHLFGLKKLVRDGEDVPALFKDEAYGKSNHWELSTSQLSSDWLDGWGYGEVVPDGFGLSYSIHDDKLRWGITTSRGPGEAAKLGQALCAAADDIRAMMDRSPAAEA